MKKAFLLLIMSTLWANLSFASFQVEKSHDALSTESVEMLAASDAAQSSSTEGKDGTIAIILAIVSVVFLPFGLHNWYLGRTKQALWQILLIFPFGILILPALASWIWQIVDLIRLLINGGTL